MSDLSNASIVVFGGLSGLGRATAERFVETARHVLVADTAERRPEGLDDRIAYVRADVTDEQAVSQALRVAATVAPVRAVVVTAGVLGIGRLTGEKAMPLDDFRRVVDINLVGTGNVLLKAGAAMAGNDPVDGDRGVIVLTSSIAAFDGGNIAYAASKAGVASMALSGAQGLASHGIRVLAIAPGLMETPMMQTASGLRAGLREAEVHPARHGRPEEFALTVEQLIANPFLNGEVIRFDGALRLPPPRPRAANPA